METIIIIHSNNVIMKGDKKMTRYNVKIGEFLNEKNEIKYGVNSETLEQALEKAKILTKLMEEKDYKIEITKVSAKI